MLILRWLIRRLAPAVTILSVFAVAGVAIAAPAARSGGDSIARFAGPRDEQWLVQAIYDELRLNTGAEKRKALSKRFEDIAMSWLATGRINAFDTGNELVHAMRACTYLSEFEDGLFASHPQLAQWLMGHAEVRRLLFRALADVDSAEKALNQFAELQAAEPEKVSVPLAAV